MTENGLSPEVTKYLKLLADKIERLNSELKRLRKENEALITVIRLWKKRDERLKNKLNLLLDNIEKFS